MEAGLPEDAPSSLVWTGHKPRTPGRPSSKAAQSPIIVNNDSNEDIDRLGAMAIVEIEVAGHKCSSAGEFYLALKTIVLEDETNRVLSMEFAQTRKGRQSKSSTSVFSLSCLSYAITSCSRHWTWPAAYGCAGHDCH